MAVSLAPNGEATALLVNELHEANIMRGIEAQTMLSTQLSPTPYANR